MNFLDPILEEYIEKHCSPESPLLAKLSRETQAKILRPRMLSGQVQGQFLKMISQMIRPTNILEIGTYTGYSALCLAEGLQEEGQLHTIDINEELEDFTQNFLQQHPKSSQIITHIGDALTIIPQLKLDFDLVFIDADKCNYQNYYELLVPRLKPGAFIIADNVLWSGKVLEKAAPNDTDTQALQAFNDHVQQDERVENLLLGLRDGLLFARKL